MAVIQQTGFTPPIPAEGETWAEWWARITGGKKPTPVTPTSVTDTLGLETTVPVGTTKAMGGAWWKWDGKDWVSTGVPAPTAQDNTPNVGLNPETGKYEYFVIGPAGKAVFVGAQAVQPKESLGFAPQRDAFTEGRTGDRVYTLNGTEVSRIPGVDWASLSPEQKFAQDQTIRRMADDAATARQAASDVAAGQRSVAGDVAAFDRSVLGETEANRRAQLQAQTSGFNTLVNTAPEFGKLALANANTVADFTRKPAYFLARAFFTRGGTSPLPQVTQADLINNLSANIGQFNSALQGYNTAPMFNPQVAARTPAPIPQVAAASAFSPYAGQVEAPAGGGNWAGFTPPPTTTAAQATQSMNAAGVPSWVPRFPAGGATTAPRFIVGDSPSGRPTGHEEMIINPTRAPIKVIPTPKVPEDENPFDPTLPPEASPFSLGPHQPFGIGDPLGTSTIQGNRIERYASGTSFTLPEDPAMQMHQKKADSIGKVIQHVDDPELQHALVDEMASHKKAMQENVPHFASGTDSSGTSWSSGPTYNSGPAPGFVPYQPVGNPLYDMLYNDRQRGGNGWLTHSYQPGQQQEFINYYIGRTGVHPGWGLPRGSEGGLGLGSPLDTPNWTPSGPAGGFQTGAGFGIPALPTVATTTQEELKALELKNRPPAITSILEGGIPKPLNLGFATPSPWQMSSLTPDEKTAFGTTLATQYNLDPTDVETSIRQRFSGSGQRGARF